MTIETVNPLIAQLTHRAFPEVAEVLRAEVDAITFAWDAAVREAMPQMRHLTFEQLKDSTPQILRDIADALASDDPDVIRELVTSAPGQGLSRFALNFDVIEVMQEDRLLRAITVLHIESALDRQMDMPESAALHAAIDVMLQRSVIALVEKQKGQLRTAAETELKFLSFLSHDMNNNLGNVTLWLEALGMDLRLAGGFAEAEDSLKNARKSIEDTLTGMRRMLDHERLRKSESKSVALPINLHAMATRVVAQFAKQADAKGVELAEVIPVGTVVESDAELLSLALQNLVGNAVKFSSRGQVRIGFGGNAAKDHHALWVSDEGPGIAPEQMARIFEAFKRGEVHGQHGVGLGLAIASQAANLLGAKLTVQSKLGAGSTFRVVLPR
jgi:signal transduction histidine kinase